MSNHGAVFTDLHNMTSNNDPADDAAVFIRCFNLFVDVNIG